MKIIKQPKLFLEKIDGTTPVDISYLYNDDKVGIFYIYNILHSFEYSFKGFRESREDGIVCLVDFAKMDEYFHSKGFNDKIVEMFRRVLKVDPYAKNFAMTYKLYKDSNNKKNYVMSKNLTKYLERISLDVPAEVLPKDFFAYIEPNDLYDSVDNTKVHCAFVAITKIKDVESLMIAYMTDSSTRINRTLYEFHTLNIVIDREKTLDDLCEESNELARKEKQGTHFLEGKRIYRTNDDKVSQSNSLRTIINTILYINGPNEEFVEQFNLFSDKIKKRRVQEKCLSTKKFIRLGYENAEHLKLIVEKDIEVGWHTKMQPYGPGRQYRKKIVVASYNRKQKNYFDR